MTDKLTSDALHAAVCNAVILLNMSVKDGEGLQAHNILREALIAYADAALLSASPADCGEDDRRDAARYRALRSALPSDYNSEKGYIRWYLPRNAGGFMRLDEALDRHIAAAPGAADGK